MIYEVERIDKYIKKIRLVKNQKLIVKTWIHTNTMDQKLGYFSKTG